MAKANGDDSIEAQEILQHVPVQLRVAGAWSWRLIVVGVVVSGIIYSFAVTSAIFIPVLVAIIIAAPLSHAVSGLKRIGIPRGLGAITMVLALVVFVLGLVAGGAAPIIAGGDELLRKVTSGYEELIAWLSDGPLGLEAAEIQTYVDRFINFVEENAGGVASGALSITGQVGAITAGVVIALISLFFFLKDGEVIWSWLVRLLPKAAQERVDSAGHAGFKMLDEYTRAQVLVAGIDAIGIGIGAWILVGLQLAIPLTIAVFLFSFLPIIGATLSLITASLVVLVDGGWVPALIIFLWASVVMWVEGNILYPWLFGRAVELHPLVIMLAVSIGTILAGLPGALLAVPTVGFAYRFMTVLGAPDQAELERRRLPDVVTQSIPMTARGRRRRKAEKAKKAAERSEPDA